MYAVTADAAGKMSPAAGARHTTNTKSMSMADCSTFLLVSACDTGLVVFSIFILQFQYAVIILHVHSIICQNSGAYRKKSTALDYQNADFQVFCYLINSVYLIPKKRIALVFVAAATSSKLKPLMSATLRAVYST